MTRSNTALRMAIVALGLVSGAVSVYLLVFHVQVITVARSVALPRLASITMLEQTADTLQKQVELAELQAATRSSLIQEQLAAYVLPQHIDMDRLVAVIDLYTQYYTQVDLLQDDASFSINTLPSEAKARVHLTAVIHENAIEDLTQFISLSGLLTVYDAFTPEQRAVLIERVEQENPTAITELESFFSSQLVEYARNPQAVQERVLRSFESAQFSNFFVAVIDASTLPKAVDFFASGYGKSLIQNHLWPLPFMQLEYIEQTKGSAKGWHSVDLTFIITTESMQ